MSGGQPSGCPLNFIPKPMPVKLFLLTACLVAGLLAQAQMDQTFHKAKDNYFRFQYTAAIQGFEQTRNYALQKGNIPIALKSFYYLAMAHFELGQIDEGLTNMWDGSDLSIEKYGEESPQSGDFYIAFGKYYHLRESYDTAKLFYLGAAELKRSESGTLDFAELYANLGYTYDFNGQYDSAVYYYELSAVLLEKLVGLYHPYTDWVYASIPYPANKSGDHKKELEAALKSLDVKGRLWGTGSEAYVSALNAVATAYEFTGDHSNEKRYAEEAESLVKRIYGINSLEHATAMYRLGNACSRLNDPETAIDYNQKALEIKKKILGSKDAEVLSIFRNIGNIYYDAGRYQQALVWYQDHFDHQVKINGKGSAALIAPYEDLGQVYEGMGNHTNALQHYQKALELKQKHSGLERGIPASLIALARIQEEKSEYQQAIKTLHEALEANSKYNDSNRETEAFIRNNLGTVYRSMDQYPEALRYLKEALAIRKEVHGESSPYLAQTLTNLGTIYLTLGQYVEAEAAFENKLKVSRTYYGPEHPEAGKALVNLANLAADRGQYPKAVQLLKEALQIQLSANGPGSPDLLSIYTNLAIAQAEFTQYTEALQTIGNAKELALTIYGEDSEQVAGIYNTTGFIHHEMGNLNQAFPLYQQAIIVYKRIYPEDHLSLATVYNNLGNAYMEFREVIRAQEYMEEALRIYKKILGEGSREYRSTLMNIGLIEDSKGDHRKAIELYNELLAGGQPSSEDDLFLAAVYQNSGNSQKSLLQQKAAITSYEKSAELRAGKLGNENPLVADLYMNIGLTWFGLNDLEKASDYYQRVKSIYEKAPNARSDVMSKLNLNLGDLESKRGNFEGAIDWADKAIRSNRDSKNVVIDPLLYFIAQVQKVDNSFLLYQKTREPGYLHTATKFIAMADEILVQADQEIFSDEDQVQFSIWKSLLTNVALKNALALYELEKNPEELERAFYYSERSKANVLVNAIYETNVRKFKGIDENLVTRERELKGSIQSLSKDLFTLENDPEADPERISALRNRFFNLKRELETLTKQLESDPGYKKLEGGNHRVSVQTIRSELIRPGEGIIEYAASDSTLHIFFITQDELVAFSKPWEERSEQLVTAFRNAIIYKSDAAFDLISDRLYRIALQDVEEYMAHKNLQIDRLIIVPEGPFNYLPFEALKRNDRYLVEDYDIRYSYSLSLSNALRQRESPRLENSCLAFAPVFADAGTATITAGAREVFKASQAVASEDLRGFSVNGEYITPLPGTEKEVHAINQLMESRGHASKLFIYADASEDVIKAGALENHRYIHFATHGFVNEANPAFSGIFMSQHQNSEEDCILFSSEIYNLQLNADLITLSACETGLGRFAYGEGIVGLTRAFLYAGARNLLVSQWKVSDESTAKMMVDFYEKMLSGKEKATALREAKLALIADPEFSKPYFWAPFVLIGE